MISWFSGSGNGQLPRSGGSVGRSRQITSPPDSRTEYVTWDPTAPIPPVTVVCQLSHG